MDDRFYRAFEDRYRGSRELISQRLEIYLPFLFPLRAIYQDLPVLDLGCGRGEWLELLCREGYEPSGVDLDDGMLEACGVLGLPARKDDALGALRSLPDNSLIAVTGFHIAEHIPFPVLQELVAEALRVLRPAGLLILETPNAESVVVGTNSFYLDPTHERPLPNLLLSFLTEHTGFTRSKIVRLQESPELRDENSPLGVWEVLSGTSPDYAVVAQKQAQPEMLASFDPVFDRAYGVPLDQVAVRYDRALERRFSGLEGDMATSLANNRSMMDSYVSAMESVKSLQAEQLRLMQERYASSAAKANAQVFDAIARADSLQVELNNSLSNAHNWFLRATGYEAQLVAMRGSTSWRLTAPLRFLVRALRWPFRATRSTSRQVLGRGVVHAQLWLARRPAIQRPLMSALKRTPWLATKLRTLYRSSIGPDIAAMVSNPLHGVIDHAPLTQRGRAIEAALRDAMTKGRN
ncbi:MAG TPA: methyltransferase domain-containing protein [Pseudomonas sp.]|jgi:O-antigen chain-terminating methyltransferase